MSEELQLFEGKRIRHIYDEEKESYYFSIVDVVAILIEKDYQSARKYWKVLKGRIIKEGYDELVTNCYQFKMQANDGKMRATDVADIKTIFTLFSPFRLKKLNLLNNGWLKLVKNVFKKWQTLQLL